MNMLKRRPVQVGAFLCTTQNHSFNPQSLRDSPGGALGTVFPKPLASLRSDVPSPWCLWDFVICGYVICSHSILGF